MAFIQPDTLNCSLNQPFHTITAYLSIIPLPDIVRYHTVMPVGKHKNSLSIAKEHTKVVRLINR